MNNQNKSSDYCQNRESKGEITRNTTTNCHRQHLRSAGSRPDAFRKDYDTDSDQDSSSSKYPVQEDDRERKDGPGGN